MSLGREGRLRRQLVEHGRVAPGEAVLDVGSGTGTLLRTVRAVVPGAVASVERAALGEAGFDEVREGRLVMRSIGLWISSVRGME